MASRPRPLRFSLHSVSGIHMAAFSLPLWEKDLCEGLMAPNMSSGDMYIGSKGLTIA